MTMMYLLNYNISKQNPFDDQKIREQLANVMLMWTARKTRLIIC